MSSPSIRLQRADDLSYVETLLERNGLPSRDVRSKPDCLYVGFDGGDRVCIGGLEIHRPHGLLRSVVVERSARGDGYGTAMCDALETSAEREGVETLYLLTTTAAGFFANRGYVEIERTDAPGAIRRTTEFDDLCPATAACMKKSL